jgi:hypothetical protein
MVLMSGVYVANPYAINVQHAADVVFSAGPPASAAPSIAEFTKQFCYHRPW